MKIGLNGSGVLAAVAVAAAGAGALWLYKNRDKFNPVSDQNVFYQGAGTVVGSLSGGAKAGGEDTLGGALARLREWLSGDDARIRAMLKGGTAVRTAGAYSDPSLPRGYEDLYL